ncbi:MAG: histidinol-phosphatase HisJ family protein [Oscillospiraceae bacterium]
MGIYDQHLHSKFSYDSRQEMEEYIIAAKAQGDKIFTTTEHMDLDSSITDCDMVPDFANLLAERSRLAKKYDIEILNGIEIGYKPITQEKIEKVISHHSEFDMIILSIHEDEYGDVATQALLQNKTPDIAFTHYLELVLYAVTHFSDFDILGHIDFIIRYVGQLDIKKYEKKLIEIFKIVIEKGKTLEINTRLIEKYGTVEYSKFVIETYAKCGGVKVSLGSDAHKIDGYKLNFETVKKILMENGISGITAYKNRKPFFMPFEG